MDMKYYQQAAITTAKPSSCNLYYMALGLAGEAGEVANKVKKIMRDNDYPAREDIKAELGDVLWYVAGMATVLGIKLDDIAAANLDKLRDRQRRGVIGGAGGQSVNAQKRTTGHDRLQADQRDAANAKTAALA